MRRLLRTRGPRSPPGSPSGLQVSPGVTGVPWCRLWGPRCPRGHPRGLRSPPGVALGVSGVLRCCPRGPRSLPGSPSGPQVSRGSPLGSQVSSSVALGAPGLSQGHPQGPRSPGGRPRGLRCPPVSPSPQALTAVTSGVQERLLAHVSLAPRVSGSGPSVPPHPSGRPPKLRPSPALVLRV